MAIISMVDAEDLVKSWLLTTDVAGLVNNKIFLAMPEGSPNPSVILSRVGGAPVRGSDVPTDVARISFKVWGRTRPQAKEVAKALVSEIESLALAGGYVSASGRLEVGEVIMELWLPEPDSDTPRYVIDALITTLAQ